MSKTHRDHTASEKLIHAAEYILQLSGEMTAMKLQRLLYFSHAWHLAWDGRPLFPDRIEAWANGPIIPALYELHRGDFHVAPGYFYAKTGVSGPPTQKDMTSSPDQGRDLSRRHQV